MEWADELTLQNVGWVMGVMTIRAPALIKVDFFNQKPEREILPF